MPGSFGTLRGNMKANFRIIIVGGGIAGLATAIALRKHDREIVVLEQSTLSREIGATISLQPNASKIVEKSWGLGSMLKETGSMIDEGFQMYNLEGQLQMRTPLSTQSKYGGERVLYHRVDLHDALRRRATSVDYPGRPAKMRLSCRVHACDCEKGVVQLEDGETIEADLIVGADGIKSALRKAVLGKDVPALPTGHSAYRMVIKMEDLEAETAFVEVVKPRKPLTTMVVGHDRRLIMGPARNSSIYSIVAMVPDDTMKESATSSSWTTKGDLDKMLEAFAIFPEWAKKPLRLAKEVGLWQLRDLDPLPTWCRGRTILIGDAAHAMLPTQGQGASQSVEDAEALGAYFSEIESMEGSFQDVSELNKMVFDCRYERATTIQTYSRQTARPATDLGSVKIKMNPMEFMDYNCLYHGALDWQRTQERQRVAEEFCDNLTLETLAVGA